MILAGLDLIGMQGIGIGIGASDTAVEQRQMNKNRQ